jgi:hypothetical protein
VKAGSQVLARPASQASTLTAEQAATAAFIADVTADLVKLADRQGFDALAYMLDVAELEARVLGPRMTPRRVSSCRQRRRWRAPN